MSYATIQVKPVTPRLGAEISNIDLTAALSNQQVEDLHTALAEHQVLFFRDQKINLEQQKTLGRHFGDLHIHPNTPGPEGHPEILPIHADANSKRANGENWHSDVSCDVEPPLGSILYLHTVPPTGGDTIFASQSAAYDALTPAFQSFLDGLTATHSGDRSYRRTNRLLGIDDRNKVFPQAVHPVIRTHPVTKRKGLFVNENFTMHINELSAEESRAVLDFLYAHSTKPAFQVRFSWQSDSIAFWDNRAVQHIAMWDYFPQTRSGYRVTIKGIGPTDVGRSVPGTALRPRRILHDRAADPVGVNGSQAVLDIGTRLGFLAIRVHGGGRLAWRPFTGSLTIATVASADTWSSDFILCENSAIGIVVVG